MTEVTVTEGGVLPFSDRAWNRATVSMSEANDQSASRTHRSDVHGGNVNARPTLTEVNHIGGASAHRSGVLGTARDKAGMPVDKITLDTLVDIPRPDGSVWSGLTVRDAITADVLGQDAQGNFFELDHRQIAETKAQIAQAQQQAHVADAVTIEPHLEAAHSELVSWMQADGFKPEQVVVDYIQNGERIPPHVAEWANRNGLPGGADGLDAHYREVLNKLVIAGLARSVAAKGINPDDFNDWSRSTGLNSSSARIGAMLELYLSGGTSQLEAMVEKYRWQNRNKVAVPAGGYDPKFGQRLGIR